MAGVFLFSAAISPSLGVSLWTDYRGHFSTRAQRIVERGYRWMLVGVLGISVMWTICTCWAEILLVPVSSEQPLVAFLQKHHLEDAVIWSAWERVYDDFKRPNTASISYGIGLNCYYGRNKIANLNQADPIKMYRVHSIATKEENTRNFANWLAKGYPEIIIGNIDWKEVEGAENPPSYVLLYKIPNYFFRKFTLPFLVNGTPVFIRQDCMEKYHLFAKKSVEK